MSKTYERVLKEYLTEKIKKTRKNLGLTQEKMAEGLEISTRSYADIERGISLCKTTTLFHFLFFCGLELNQMQKEIEQLWESEFEKAN